MLDCRDGGGVMARSRPQRGRDLSARMTSGGGRREVVAHLLSVYLPQYLTVALVALKASRWRQERKVTGGL